MTKQNTQTQSVPVGENVSARVEGTRLIIECDISDKARAAAGLSSTGKMKMLAKTSGGWTALPLPGAAAGLRMNFGLGFKP